MFSILLVEPFLEAGLYDLPIGVLFTGHGTPLLQLASQVSRALLLKTYDVFFGGMSHAATLAL